LNPGLEISSPLISKLVPRMVDDALKLTIDAKYYKNKEESSKYHVDGYDDNENMWERFNVI
jgi:tubulin--tyrosine ligase/tubulin polyglutamylase TTLL9